MRPQIGSVGETRAPPGEKTPTVGTDRDRLTVPWHHAPPCTSGGLRPAAAWHRGHDRGQFPKVYQGVLPGDAGFDPLGFADETNLARMREAEVRHGRLAMVATWGWPVAELGLHIAQALVPPASVCTGNGCAVDATITGLTLPTIALIGETYWTALLLAAFVGELRARRQPGVPAFDPLDLASRRRCAQSVEPTTLAEL